MATGGLLHDPFRPEAVHLFLQVINSLPHSADIPCEGSACKVSKTDGTLLTLSLTVHSVTDM